MGMFHLDVCQNDSSCESHHVETLVARIVTTEQQVEASRVGVKAAKITAVIAESHTKIYV